MLNPLVVLDLLVSAALICATAYYSYRVGKRTHFITPWALLAASTLFGAMFLIIFVILVGEVLQGGALFIGSFVGAISLFLACLCAFLGMYTLSNDFEKIVTEAQAKGNG